MRPVVGDFGAAARAAACGVALLAAGGGVVEALELAPHRAAYSLSLAGTDLQVGLKGVEGTLAIEWRADCTGWLSSQRITYTTLTEEGSGFASDVGFSSWESRDGRRMRFSRRTFDGDQVVSQEDGEASLPSAGAPGEARYHGAAGTVPLPPGTVFPTTHVVRLIAAAQAGHSLTSEVVFDGSGEDALHAVTAVIGAPQRVDRPDAARVERWPVSMAYHDPRTGDLEPRFQLSFELAADGVLRRLVLDYGDFALDAEMRRIERLEAPRCG